MFQSFIRNSAVGLFGLVARSGILRLPMIEPAFLALYAVYKKYLEAGPIDRLREFVPGGSLVIDVGANVGFFSVRFAQWVGSSGEVIAIEPEDKNYNNLIAALKHRDLSERVHAIKAVAASKSGTMFLEVNSLHPADHKLSREGKGIVVDAVTLDELVILKDVSVLSLIKIDVQGAEMLVLQGASCILKETSPALFIELHEDGLAKFGTSTLEILNYLSAYGYEPYWLVRSGQHRKTGPLEIRERIARVGYVDVLFLKAPNRP
jgi:FkbM family methyltransferase